MGASAPRRLLPVFFIAILIILTSAYYVASLRDAVPSPADLVSTVGDKLSSVGQSKNADTDQQYAITSVVDSVPKATPVAADKSKATPNSKTQPTPDPAGDGTVYQYSTPATEESEKGKGALGEHYHIRPTTATPESVAVAGCEYPVMVHTSGDAHCTGALALYASIVRNTLNQPEHLQGKTCVHFTYVDTELRTIEEMYQWKARSNPFSSIADCAALDTTPEYNSVVPVRWQALAPIEKPRIMEAAHVAWLAALNKVHSWAFDAYPRVLYLDADSFVMTDLHKIFNEVPLTVSISAVPDQYNNCHDRSRMNGGMVLFRPSRYIHIVMLELLHDEHASCMSGKWEQSEQELLNCFCGYNYQDRPRSWMPRPEFECSIMPMWNSVWPKNYHCSDANVMPMRSIHFTAVTKPWNVPEDKLEDRFDTKFYKCLRDNGRDGNTYGLKECVIPSLEETRLLGDDIPGKIIG